MDICLTKFDIYEDTVAQILDVLIFFRKKVLPDLSEIHLVRHNLVSTRQSDGA